jgi:hypothetical protein
LTFGIHQLVLWNRVLLVFDCWLLTKFLYF